ncbi:MAG: hypothetical protein Q4C49_06500 [Bacillota bacterium]|nr:hypothetical protein [Bacillota bacterium]
MREHIITLVFCITILSITISTFFNMVQNTSEKTDLQKKMEIERKEDDKDLLQVFSDNLAGKEEGAKLASSISKATSGMTYIESTQVLLGKDDWLFYKREDDGNPLGDYEGAFRYTEEELLTFSQKLERDQEIFNSLGCEFLVLTAPNKSNVYFEYMPDTIPRQSNLSSVDQLFDYLQTNSSIRAINTKPALIQAKDLGQVYYSTDTHFNRQGAFIAVQELFKTIEGREGQPFSSARFTVTNEHFSGDLATLANMNDIFQNDTFYEFDPTSVDLSFVSDKKVLIIGDSFGEAMYPVLAHYFQDVHFHHVLQFTTDMIAEYQPDIVVWEVVERQAQRYLEVNLWE